ncbi:MAG TPA: malectin domain-containing carbohydrate-binding protein [Ktedonobacteraceae bacterium]|nr:malectin domain-containing carbohydrate-binding protein [Ktedonobacteraceae bacterium]
MKQKFASLATRSRALLVLPLLFATLVFTGVTFLSYHRSAQASSIVQVGAGSYTTAPPSNLTLPPNTIYRTSNVTGPMPTSDWWTSVAWTQPAYPIYPLPLALQTTTTGIGVDYPDIEVETGAIHAGYNTDFTLGASSGTFPSPNPLVDGYSDWTVSMLWNNGSGGTMRVTAGQGMPYLYATYASENPQLTFSTAPTIWSGTASSNVLGITINGHNYGLFGPSGSTWTGLGTTTLTNNAQGKTYFSLAALPDNTTSTLQAFQQYAYSFVTNTQVSWSYDQNTSEVHTTYAVTTQAEEGTQTGTIMALFPSQWKVTNNFSPLSYTYHSVRGTMKTMAGSSFSTTLTYHGILPYFPDVGQYNQATLLDDIESFADQSRSPTVGDTYWGGKALLQVADLLPIAREAGLTTAYNNLLAWLEGAMADHFTATDSSGNPKTTDMFYYDPTWGTIIGDPASYGSDSDLNDHHFHYGYWIQSAAEIARADPSWVSKYGGMVDLLIDDIADPSRNDPMFPFLRNFSPYEGHSWASGSELAAWGNNQESSSEAINAWAGLIEWGEATGNAQITDLGIYLYTTETYTVEQDWFDVDHDIFPAGYGYDYTAQVWGGQNWFGTYFSADPQEIRGINLIPITSSSLYLADDTAYEQEFLQAMAQENGSDTWTVWQDSLWEYQALIDAPGAIQLFNAQPNYTPGASETKAFTYTMLYDLQTLGEVDAAITANTPLYAVFNHSGTINHVAYNASSAPITVTFSDGTSFSVPAGQISVNGTTIPLRTLPPPSGLQINAGGGEDYPFVADTDFSGGATASSSNAIDTSGASNPAPEYVYQTNRYGNFTYTIPNLTPNTSYPVRLDFAETYWTSTGQRVFNVTANGQQVLTNFDIVAAAGGPNKAVDEQFNVTADSSGTITLQFTSVVDNAQVNGIEILGASSTTPAPTPTPSPTPVGGAGGVQINAGGSAAAPFIADTDFSGGSTAASSNAIDTSGVSNPAPQAVYQTNRYGNFTYTIPNLTPGASYTVRLHFAETYWTQTGQRVFNVNINGSQVLTNFDIIAAAGAANKAVVEQFTATASSGGTITIQFVTVKDNAQVNGIEVLGGSSPTPTPTSTPPPAGSVQINCGGSAAAPFVADTDFTGGSVGASTTSTINTSGVSNPAPQAVYQTNRIGTSFSYTIPNLTPGASYTVRLHFAETYWTAAGKRIFNVSINGSQVLTNFDIFATAGSANKAVVEQFTATASASGTITIQFTAVVDNAQINGIEVLA